MQLVARDFDISPDQTQVVFVARPDTRTNHPGDAEIYLLSLEDKSITRVTNNAAPESSVMWSPDGSYIAYRAPDDQTHELRSGYFWIMDPDSHDVRRLDGQSTGELSTEASWSADSRYIIYNEIQGTNTNLYRMNVRNGEAQALTTIAGTLRAHDFSSDTNRMVYSQQDFTTSPDLYIGDLRGRRAQQITDLNPWVKSDLALSDGELLTWTSKGGMQIEGVFFPAIGNGTDKSPLIVHIHGGPAGVIENGFRHSFQILAGQGYSILAPNFRGSTGYGDDLLRGLIGEVGDGEYQDVMTGVDLVIAEKNVDPDRMGVRGWSWGGVSTSYVITQTDRFKAASIGAMVGNWAAETGPGFNFDVSLWYIGGMAWDNPEEWRQRSSITHVKNVSTPSIIFHGGRDETSSVGQSLMFYTALREIGKVPVRYMKFPREGHGIDEPRHVRRLESEEISWFKKYIDGEEWSLGPRD
jgi:dipeptidyl aminopeptidase/acylaminoacyl peptidase